MTQNCGMVSATAPENAVTRKRPQVVEDHHDDCGEDFSPLGEDVLVTSYYEDLQLDYSGTYDGGYDADIYLQLDGRADPKDELRLALDESYCTLDWHCGMNGSDYTLIFLQDLCEGGTPVVFDDIEAFARWDASVNHPYRDMT